jgi:hypothetical protein
VSDLGAAACGEAELPKRSAASQLATAATRSLLPTATRPAGTAQVVTVGAVVTVAQRQAGTGSASEAYAARRAMAPASRGAVAAAAARRPGRAALCVCCAMVLAAVSQEAEAQAPEEGSCPLDLPEGGWEEGQATTRYCCKPIYWGKGPDLHCARAMQTDALRVARAARTDAARTLGTFPAIRLVHEKGLHRTWVLRRQRDKVRGSLRCAHPDRALVRWASGVCGTQTPNTGTALETHHLTQPDEAAECPCVCTWLEAPAPVEIG